MPTTEVGGYNMPTTEVGGYNMPTTEAGGYTWNYNMQLHNLQLHYTYNYCVQLLATLGLIE